MREFASKPNLRRRRKRNLRKRRRKRNVINIITKLCPVAEFGLVGQTMHKVDENVATADIDGLSAIYETAIRRFFAGGVA